MSLPDGIAPSSAETPVSSFAEPCSREKTRTGHRAKLPPNFKASLASSAFVTIEQLSKKISGHKNQLPFHLHGHGRLRIY